MFLKDNFIKINDVRKFTFSITEEDKNIILRKHKAISDKYELRKNKFEKYLENRSQK